MASLELHYGTYRLAFRFGGRKFRRSLKTDKERIALAALARAEDNLRRLELGQLVLPEGADVAAFVLSDGRLEHKPKLKAPEFETLASLLDGYLSALANKLEPTTEHCTRVHVRHFKRILGENRPWRALDLATLQGYVDRRALEPGMRGKTVSPTTILKEVNTLGSIWGWALDHELIERPMPRKGLRYPKLTDKPPFQTIEEIERKIKFGSLRQEDIDDLWDAAFLTLSEIETLLSHVKRHALHPCIYPMFVFAAHTGARRSEMRRSQIEDLDFTGKRIFVRERKRVRGRHTIRSVPMSPLLHRVLTEWLHERPGGRHVFSLEAHISKSAKDREEPIPITDDEVGHHFKQALLGTKWEKLRGWHVFRHSFCSNCAAQGVDQRMINAWVGHQTEEMVRRYRHMIPNQEHAAIANVFG